MLTQSAVSPLNQPFPQKQQIADDASKVGFKNKKELLGYTKDRETCLTCYKHLGFYKR